MPNPAELKYQASGAELREEKEMLLRKLESFIDDIRLMIRGESETLKEELNYYQFHRKKYCLILLNPVVTIRKIIIHYYNKDSNSILTLHGSFNLDKIFLVRETTAEKVKKLFVNNKEFFDLIDEKFDDNNPAILGRFD